MCSQVDVSYWLLWFFEISFFLISSLQFPVYFVRGRLAECLLKWLSTILMFNWTINFNYTQLRSLDTKIFSSYMFTLHIPRASALSVDLFVSILFLFFFYSIDCDDCLQFWTLFLIISNLFSISFYINF